ncbi:hypothetical protein C8C93_2091 [Acidovorax sp. 93]|uniref:hypothetical protein n=1 Tax=Acidovorax sp. 93 TaxID=2135632 RepID=UPI000F1462DA|nr:hypothetical protein [Acidovorax sp. 93]RKR26841.1 hypothetical protein C8C93_2091 [Acidovorax sp. 93]
MTEQQAIDGARISPGLAKSPYSVETYSIGSCVCNADGFNVLSFAHKPGAKFTTQTRAQAICDRWNSLEVVAP